MTKGGGVDVGPVAVPGHIDTHYKGNGEMSEHTGFVPEQGFAPATTSKDTAKARAFASTYGHQASSHTRLEAFFKIFHGDDHVLVIINADPDAIASAVAVKRLLWRKVSHVVVAAVNDIKRPDNLQLIEALKLKLKPLADLDLSTFSRLVMVDSQPHHHPHTIGLDFAAIIDHHPVPLFTPKKIPTFVDIRPDLGATATMMVGYLKAAKVKPNLRLATALFYAIKTDTQNFVRQGQLEDMRAFRWLYPYIHPPLLSDIERAPIARSSFKTIVDGLENAVFCKNTVHTFLGETDHADTLVILADFLMKIKGINRSWAAGICGPKLVIIFRAGGMKQNVGKLAGEAFGHYGSAGGHKNMARAEIPLENLDPKTRDHQSSIYRFILRKIKAVDDKKI